jgi:hypothetical protein
LSNGRLDPQPAARMQAGQPFPQAQASIRSPAIPNQASARSYAPAANPLPGRRSKIAITAAPSAPIQEWEPTS